MWLMYPLTDDDLRRAKRGVAVLMGASAVWYLTLAGVLAVWTDEVLFKVRSKFDDSLDVPEKDWTPFIVLLVGYTLAGLLRLLGYRYCRNVGGGVSAGDGVTWAEAGAVVWVGTVGTLYFGFSGFLGIVAAVGTFLELRFLRFPVQQFSMVVSLDAVRWVNRFFWARVVWLAVAATAGLVMVIAHILTDIPRPIGGPSDQQILQVNAVLKVAFNVLAVAAVVTLPVLTAGYWLILNGIAATVDRLLDPNGPKVPPQEVTKAGFAQLKNLIHNQP